MVVMKGLAMTAGSKPSFWAHMGRLQPMSLATSTVIAMVKVEYNKTVTGAEIRNCNTVEDLFNLVAAK